MDESVVKHLEQRTNLKLSEAIRIGCPWVQEHRLYSGCAIGTAYRAVMGLELLNYEDGEIAEYRVARIFNVPVEHVIRVSGMHYKGTFTREQCADWLEAKGY